MRGNELLNKMELIDSAYVEAADVKVYKSKSNFVKWGAAAACLCLALASAFIIKDMLHTQNDLITDAPALNSSADTEIAIVGGNSANDYTVIVIEPAVEPDTNHNAFLPFIPSDGPHASDSVDVTPLISSWGEGKYNVDVDANVNVDMAVGDGKVYFSDSLTAAMNHYGDTANYRVLVELFDDDAHISSGSQAAIKESERLSGLGYIVAMETVTQTEIDGEYTSVSATYYFTLHATYDQLKTFIASDELGYSLMLYGEYFGESQNDELVIFNGASTTDCEEIWH